MSYRYLLFNKPYDVLSQFSEATGSQASSDSPPPRTLKDYIAVPGVYPVGRLDRDSEGLLLLTDHGWMQHRLSHPRFQHPRTYWVQVERVPDDSALNQLRQGVAVQDYKTRPAQVQLIEPMLLPRDPPIRVRQHIPTAWLEMILTEGRNRQVRRMTAAVGFPTLRLVRVSIAHLQLGSLAPGQWRDLTSEELTLLERLSANQKL